MYILQVLQIIYVETEIIISSNLFCLCSLFSGHNTTKYIVVQTKNLLDILMIFTSPSTTNSSPSSTEQRDKFCLSNISTSLHPIGFLPVLDIITISQMNDCIYLFTGLQWLSLSPLNSFLTQQPKLSFSNEILNKLLQC